jgi:hypothetical protein
MTPTGARHAEIHTIANREVRVVPAAWRHPKDANGRYVPLLAEQMPDVASLPTHDTRIAAYETTTEGTPISPPFTATPEGRLRLTQHCADNSTTLGDHTADAEAWAVVLFGQGAAITADGIVVAND